MEAILSEILDKLQDIDDAMSKGDINTHDALQALVNHLESDPSLYDGDDNGELGRAMQNAHKTISLQSKQKAAKAYAMKAQLNSLYDFVSNKEDEANRTAWLKSAGVI